jgi:glutathione peroxidase
MNSILTIAASCFGVLAMNINLASAQEAAATTPQAAEATPLNQEMKTLDGKKVNLAKKYDDKVVLLVNVASKCGYTKQYKELQALHEKYADEGLAVVGVPCNQFGGQEPGTASEIAEFCKANYGVEFDMMAKVDVNGENAAPLYKYLTSEETNPEHGGKIKWNFEKFLFDRDGQLVARYESKVKPDAPEVVEAIEAELAKQP